VQLSYRRGGDEPYPCHSRGWWDGGRVVYDNHWPFGRVCSFHTSRDDDVEFTHSWKDRYEQMHCARQVGIQSHIVGGTVQGCRKS